MLRLLKAKSFRFWIGLGAFFALAPLILSAVGGYTLLNYGVIAAFQDVAERQRVQVVPVQNLRILLLDTLAPVDEFLDGADATRLEYRALRTQIETGFSALDKSLQSEPEARDLLARAREDWSAADDDANELISVSVQAGDADALVQVQRFHGQIASATDKLMAVYRQLFEKIENDHDGAHLYYERSLWIAGIAGGVSLSMVIGGIALVSRIMATSVDRLVDGAERFAGGDRDYRIEVQVPHELHRVAEEFNRMITRIQDYEVTLADLAHTDSLTHLPNRRAFDAALNEVLAEAKQMGKTCALMILDIDYFKRINDTYGHAAGDAVLRELGLVMARHLRPSDRSFRIGGEEFSILLPGADLTTGIATAERLRQAVELHDFTYKDISIKLTVSIGVADTNDCFDSLSLVEAADARLYEAKRSGRNRVLASPENPVEAGRRSGSTL
ncbi:sensor domain-containing diguanylate cyclase [Roseibium aggregatum]|uniref:diguanylate cyclase n=1 Tax=Roseibium aggregatum TaxID=187304 RepID=A0A926S3H5_9HYPH|nr:sensor domain-containing diguanylate cyclase [Roseibium aggregatum]MBD1545333.1 diguanylate cyclase [Roseibium aggregatum]